MANRSGQRAGSSFGRSCGCFSLGVITGMVALPVIIFLVFSVPSMQRLLGGTFSRFFQARVQQVYERITTAPPAPRGEGAGETLTERSGDYTRLLTYEGLRIRYRVSGPEDGREPFVYGEVENAGRRNVQVLQLIVNIPRTDSDGRVSAYQSESFEVMRETARAEADELRPGTKKTFLLHPASAPPGWTAESVSLKVKTVKYLD
jgi:hypothetical protein